MPSDANTDSRGSLAAELTIIVPGRPPFVVATHEHLQAIEMEVSAGGAWTAAITLFDADGGALEDLVLAGGRDRRATFRFGLADPGGLASLPQFNARILSYEPTVSMQGLTLRMNLIPDLFAHAVVDLGTTPRSWKGGTNIADIFREIAKVRKWDTVIKRPGEDAARSSVQDTSNTVPEAPSCASGEHHVAFINRQLAPYATDSEGRGGFKFFVDSDNVYHFHNNFYLKQKLQATYQFGRDAMGEVIDFAPQDATFFMAMLGAGDAVYEALDAIAGRRTEVVTGSASGIPDVKSTVQSDAAYKTALDDGEHARVAMPERETELMKARCANQYARLSDYNYAARMSVRGTHNLSPMGTVAVNYVKRDGSKHYLSGTFTIAKVRHMFDSSGWTTEVDMWRPGITFVPAAVKIRADGTVVTQAGADTHDTTKPAPTTGTAGAGKVNSVNARPGSNTPRSRGGP